MTLFQDITLKFRSGTDYTINYSNKVPDQGFESCGGMLSGPCGQRGDRSQIAYQFIQIKVNIYGGALQNVTD